MNRIETLQNLLEIAEAVKNYQKLLREAKKSQNRLFSSGLSCAVINHHIKKYDRVISLLEVRYDRFFVWLNLQKMARS